MRKEEEGVKQYVPAVKGHLAELRKQSERHVRRHEGRFVIFEKSTLGISQSRL